MPVGDPMTKPDSGTAVSWLLLLVSFAVGGCGLLEPDPFREQLRELDRAQARWTAEGPSAYRMVYQRFCFCTFATPVEIVVGADGVVERRIVESDEPVPEGVAYLFPPVEGLFDEIRDALRGRPADFRAEYHPVLGYPVDVQIDPRREVSDDEVTHRVLEVGPLY